MSQQITDENQIELLSPETDSKPRLAKQAIFATLGAVCLLLPLLPFWSQTGTFGTALIIIALLITPGLALDGILFGGMRRISGSLIGITLTTGIAWYAGLASLLFTLGYKLDIVMISTITSATAIIAVIIMLLTGQAVTRIKPEKSDLKGVFVSLITVAGLLIISASSWLVASQMSIIQPEGKLTSLHLEDANISLENPYNVADNAGKIVVTINSNMKNDEDFTVSFFNEKNGKMEVSSQFSSPKYETAVNKEVSLSIPEFVGCGTLSIKYGNLTIDGVNVKSSDGVKCKTVAVVDVFERFNIDTKGAPTTSLKDLLKYLQEQGGKTDMSALPDDYKNCISKTDPDAVSSCLEKIES